MNDSRDLDTELQELLSELLDGSLDQDGRQRLNDRLSNDRVAQNTYLDFCEAHAALAWEHGQVVTSVSLSPQAQTQSARSKRSWTRVATILGTVVATLLLAAFLWLANRDTDRDAPVATLVAEIDAALMYGGQSSSGAELAAGEYRLDRGLLHMRFGGGVMVYAEAPARFDILSDEHLLLYRGRLSASVPPEGIGFTVVTPEAEVIDFGTEFSVDVESGTSEVHVFDGLVRVQPRSRANGEATEAVDLRTSQAVKVEAATRTSVNIELATNRFIRNFDEPKRKYLRCLKLLSPVAFYRMGIRDKGLVSEPPQYSGQVLTGDGIRPPHARGVFAGGSLRAGGDSTGRGGRVNTPPPLDTGQFTLAVFVYLEARSHDLTVATNIHGDKGNFALSLDENGVPQTTVRANDGELHSVSSNTPLPLKTWCHLVMTADGDQLRLYEAGQPVASVTCESMATSVNETLWFGTDADGIGLWNGRIDELAFFDKALSDKDIAEFYQVALEEIARSE